MAVLVLVVLLFAFVGSVMEFAFVESLRSEEIHVRRYWTRYWRRGARLFGFRVGLGLVALLLLAVSLAQVPVDRAPVLRALSARRHGPVARPGAGPASGRQGRGRLTEMTVPPKYAVRDRSRTGRGHRFAGRRYEKNVGVSVPD